MSNTRHGYFFEDEVRKELFFLNKETGLWYEKLVDTHSFKVLIGAARKLKFHALARFTMPRQPADFMVVHQGRITFLECKSSKVKTSFGIKRVFRISKSGRYQLDQSHKILKAGGLYYFLICRRVPYEMELYVLKPKVIQRLLNQVIRSKRASVKWEVIRKNATLVIEKGTTQRPWPGLLPLLSAKR